MIARTRPRTDLLATVAFSTLLPLAALAETTTPVSPLAGWEFGAYFDSYYQTSSQAHAYTGAPSNSAAGPRVVEGRAFDRLNDQITLNMVELSARKKAGKVALRIDAAFGEMVDVLANAGPQNGSMANGATNPAANEPTRNITQATLAYTPVNELTITLGKFYTPIGSETTKAKDNFQYSRSFSFNYGIPFWHEGVSLAYGLIPSKLTATAYVVNNLDGRLAQVNSKSPAYAVSLAATPIEALTANYTFLTAAEAGYGNGKRDLHDVNVAYSFGPKYTIAADYIMGLQKSAGGTRDTKWNGFAFYAKAQLCSFYALSPRFELYDDSDAQTTSVAQKLTGITIANNFNLGDGLEARLEYRNDKSDRSTYFKDGGGSATDKQETFTLAVMYAF